MPHLFAKSPGGRPALTREERLSYVLSIRVTKEEFLRVTGKAKLLGFRPAWYLRQILLEGSDSIRARPSKTCLKTAARIASIASGLTRLIRLAERQTPLPSEIVRMLDSVHAIARATILELREGPP